MNLIQQINESADKLLTKQAVTSANIERLSESLGADDQPLTEAATEWLAQLRGKLSKGALEPNQKKSIAYILGALGAISDDSGAASEAFDDINRLGLGNVLRNAGNKDVPAESKNAIKALYTAGHEPSAKSYVDNAMQKLDNPQEINDLIGKLQTTIDQIMRTAVAKQQGGATSATGGAGVGGSPERAA